MTGTQPPPPQPEGAKVEPDPGTLQGMNQSAEKSASPAQNGVAPCPKKSWFAIRIIDEKSAVVEGLTIKLKIPDLGETDRVTSKPVDPIKIDQLNPGGKGDVKFIDSGEVVWEAVGDIT